MNIRLSLWLLSVTTLLVVACESPPVYQETRELPQSGWIRGDSIVFEFEAPDTVVLYDLALSLRHTDSFIYQNLYTQIGTYFPSGQLVTDITNFDLADHKGTWYGDCRRGQCEAQAILQTGFRFRELGRHRLVIRPHMRTYPITGIEALELSLDKTLEEQ